MDIGVVHELLQPIPIVQNQIRSSSPPHTCDCFRAASNCISISWQRSISALSCVKPEWDTNALNLSEVCTPTTATQHQTAINKVQRRFSNHVKSQYVQEYRITGKCMQTVQCDYQLPGNPWLYTVSCTAHTRKLMYEIFTTRCPSQQSVSE